MKRTLVARSASARRQTLLVALLLAVVSALALPLRLFAHPLGNFTVNRYSRIDVANDALRLTYIVDMAEIPAHQERLLIDRDHNGTVSAEESRHYLDELTATLATALQITINDDALLWQPVDQQLSFPIGQAGLPTLRVVTQWQAIPVGKSVIWQAYYRDTTFADRLGWQEVIVRGGATAKLLDSTAPVTDVTDGLTTYPSDLLQSPLAITEATFRVEPRSGANGEALDHTGMIAVAPMRSRLPADPFTELVNITILSPWAILLALLAAFGWGAAHAFSPGHGKTVVAAYLVGSRGTVGHALFLGVTTTITHTAGVFLLGLITLFASRYVLPETLYPWLSVLSGLLVVAIGLTMVRERWLRPSQRHRHDHHHAHGDEEAYQQAHDHHHSHDIFGHHHHDHDHDHDHDHSHLPPGSDGTPVTWRTLLALGISGGLLPCPSALVLMLGAISLGRIGFGLALIVFFSLGLASVLTAIGITLVYASQYFQRIPESGRLLRLLPVASAIVITLIGLGITVQALLTVGTFRFV